MGYYEKKVLVIGAVNIDIFADVQFLSEYRQCHNKKGEINIGIGGTAYNVACAFEEDDVKVNFISALKKRSLFTRIIQSVIKETKIKSEIIYSNDISESGFIAHRVGGKLENAVTSSGIENIEIPPCYYKEILVKSDFVFIDANCSIDTIKSLLSVSPIPVYIGAVSEIKAQKLHELKGLPVAGVFLNKRERSG